MKKHLVFFLLLTTTAAAFGQVKKLKPAGAKPVATTSNKNAAGASSTTAKTLAAPSKDKASLKKEPNKPAVQPQQVNFQVKKTNLLNLGVGLGTFYAGLPFGASFEHGFSDFISAGVFVDYSSHNYGDFGDGSDKLTILYAGVRGSYHFGNLLNLNNNKVDLYGGASLGYHHVNYTFADQSFISSPYDNSIFFGVHAGARYLFTDHLGAFAEVGYGVAALKVGATLKF